LAALRLLLQLGEGSRLGLLALVPGFGTIAGARWQAVVLGQDPADFLAAGRCRVLASRALVLVGLRLIGRNQLMLTFADQVGAAVLSGRGNAGRLCAGDAAVVP